MTEESSSQFSSVMELLDRARAGDDDARDALFAKCRAYLSILARTQVRRCLQAKVDASDLVQQTLLEAHRGLGGFRGTTQAEWLTWLKRILAHNTADFARRYYGTEKRQLRREVPLHVPAGDGSADFVRDPSDQGASPSELVMQRESELELSDALTQLPEDYQEVIMLRNLERMPFDEVARQMGRSRPAVQMLWMRAIKKLEERTKRSRG